MPQKARTFAVIGLGTFGRTVASELASLGNEVLGIDLDQQKVNQIADDLDQAVIADARDEKAMREAGLADCDVALVAIGTLEGSILATMTAQILGVPNIWVKAMDRMHHRVLHRIGATRVIHPEGEIGMHVAQMLHTPFMVDYMSLGNRSLIAMVEVPEGLEGRSPDELGLPKSYDVRCLGLVRGTEFLVHEDKPLTLEGGDRMLLLGRKDELRRLGTSLMDVD